ncbi:MAG TPA: hypothetical protein VMF55_12940 [Solirubrobacterales bacterium]|nr:hypothetical protein [Solirubrobacterales bacterium]
MSAPRPLTRRLAARRRLLLVAVVAALAAAVPVVAFAGDPLGEGPAVQPWIGVIENGSTLIDASPGEAPGEVWAIGAGGRISRFTDAGGWTEMPAPLDAEGRPVANLKPATGQLAARATPDGAVALLADQRLFVRDPGGTFHVAAGAGAATTSGAPTGASAQAGAVAIGPAVALPDPAAPSYDLEVPAAESTLPTYEPEAEAEPPAEEADAAGEPETGGSDGALAEALPAPEAALRPAPRAAGEPAAAAVEGPEATAPEAGPPLEPGEQLYDTPLVAALSEGGKAGAFVVPSAGADGARDAVLHFDGTRWSREPICLGAAPTCAPPPSGFSVVAIDASGVGNAWLLGTGTGEEAGIVLIHRAVEDGGPVWRPVSLGGSPYAKRLSTVAGTAVGVSPRAAGQPLVVTAAGVWVDANLSALGVSRSATLYYDLGSGTVTGTWCDLPGAAGEAFCGRPLGAQLGNGRSFAWADGSAYGERLIVGLEQGSLLRLSGEAFERVPGGGQATQEGLGAAFDSPADGWLGSFFGPIRYGGTQAPDRLRLWPVPFRHPLTAAAPEPGKPVGAIGSEALAVGDKGEVARYLPGVGWSPETLLGPTGKAATPRLRAVAWPTEAEAFAVGDAGEMWRWRRATGLWESDPGKPATADVAVANFTGIAFDPGDPGRGYAIGKQGVLLGYGKQWTQEPLPAGMEDAMFTSIAFAGSEAIVTFKIPFRDREGQGYTGGILVEDGSGWHEDREFAAAMPAPGEESGVRGVVGLLAMPEQVAGLADGAAIVATGSRLIEREGAGMPWRQGAPLAGFPVALSAIREAGALRAIVSVAPTVRPEALLAIDEEAVLAAPPPNQAPVLVDPYPIPTSGDLVRQTASGWEDQQHQAWPVVSGAGSNYDYAQQPDPILALMTDAEGRFGWALGGDSGLQTATVARYPDDGQAAPGSGGAPLRTRPGWTSFAIGGGAECLGPCADLAQSGAGPWRWLPAAVRRAGEVEGVRAFLDTGGGIAGPAATGAFAYEESGAAARLTLAAGALPVYQAAASTDREAGGGLEAFLGAFGAASAPLGARPAGAAIAPVAAAGAGRGYYAFDASAPGGGRTRVIVLDTSTGSLGQEQRCWLGEQLGGAAAAGIPAIAVGNAAVRSLGDADPAAAALVTGISPGCEGGRPAGASAYFYDEPEANRESQLSSGTEAIPAYGSGSLGYIEGSLVANVKPNSGFLVVEVDPAPADRGPTNRAPVAVRLIPNISELALDAADGTLLRRSQVALFEGLARRPRAGLGCRGAPNCRIVPADPYTPIPGECIGASCIGRIEPEYHFTSSAPDIADFVARDPTSADPRQLLLDKSGDPVADSSSGVLCAYNAGTTTVTVETGGLAYSMRVTVQPGRVRRPCGTVPLRNPPRPAQSVPLEPFEFGEPEPTPRQPRPAIPVPPAPAPAAPAPVAPPTPIVAPPAKHPAPLPPAPLAAPLPMPPTSIAPLAVIVPPPPPPAAQTTPPSGTSPVTQPVTSPNPEDEDETAIEMVHHAVAHRDLLAPATTPSSGLGLGFPLVIALMVGLASLSGAGLIVGRRQAPLATASLRRYQ